MARKKTKKSNNKNEEFVDKLKNITPEEAKSALEFMDNFKNADLDKIKSDALNKIDEMNIPDNYAVKDILLEELNLWNIDITDKIKLIIDFLCNELTKDKLDSRPSYDDVIKLIDKNDKFTASMFINIFNNIIKNANFINTKFFPSLSRIRREDITPVILLNEIIDYTYDDVE